MDVEDCIRVKEFGQVKKEISMKLIVFYKGHNLLTYKGKGHLGIIVELRGSAPIGIETQYSIIPSFQLGRSP